MSKTESLQELVGVLKEISSKLSNHPILDVGRPCVISDFEYARDDLNLIDLTGIFKGYAGDGMFVCFFEASNGQMLVVPTCKIRFTDNTGDENV